MDRGNLSEQKPYLSVAKTHTNVSFWLQVFIYYQPKLHIFNKFWLKIISYCQPKLYILSIFWLGIILLTRRVTGPRSTAPLVLKPGSNGNPFYCISVISPILAAGNVKFAIKRLECITGLQHPRRYECSFSNEKCTN